MSPDLGFPCLCQTPTPCYHQGLPWWSDVKGSACNEGDPDSIPGSGRSHGEENGNPLQYSCLENPMDGGVWEATVHGVTKSRTRLSDFTWCGQEQAFWPGLDHKMSRPVMVLLCQRSSIWFSSSGNPLVYLAALGLVTENPTVSELEEPFSSVQALSHV